MPKLNSRRKGAAYERDTSSFLKWWNWPARRSQQFCGIGVGDVVVEDDGWPLHIECKNTQRLNLDAAMDQAVRDCPSDLLPSVWHHRNHGEHFVTMRRADFMELLPRAVNPNSRAQ